MGKILISIDHKWRDLAGYVYLKLLLEERGHNVYFVRSGFEEAFARGLKPDLVIMVHLYIVEVLVI